jgi:hypothetical protein
VCPRHSYTLGLFYNLYLRNQVTPESNHADWSEAGSAFGNGRSSRADLRKRLARQTWSGQAREAGSIYAGDPQQQGTARPRSGSGRISRELKTSRTK